MPQPIFIRPKKCKLLANENNHFDIAIYETMLAFLSLSLSLISYREWKKRVKDSIDKNGSLI